MPYACVPLFACADNDSGNDDNGVDDVDDNDNGLDDDIDADDGDGPPRC